MPRCDLSTHWLKALPRRPPHRSFRLTQRSFTECQRPLRASSASDPYQILGVSRKTSSDNVHRAYRTKLFEAKQTGDEQLIAAIEDAHTKIMMQELNRRMEGKGSVPKDIAYADKAIYLPWRPRFCMASKRMMVITLALQVALWLYAFVVGESTGTQPVIGSALICAFVVYFKLEKLFPSGAGLAFSADETERKQGGKNLLRCAAVAIMGTVAGILIFFTIPDLFSSVILRKPLPFWVYDSQDFLLNSGAILMNTIMAIFYR